MDLTSQSSRRLAVIIVHYKTPAVLADCLISLLPELDLTHDEIVIVDNASGEPDVSPLRKLTRPGITLIESPKNLGFAGGNNLAIRHFRSQGDPQYWLLLNPDTLLRPGAIHTLLSFLEAHPSIDCVGPRLENPDGSPQLSAFGNYTPLSELLRGANIGLLSRLLPRVRVYGDLAHAPHPADWLAGACILLRTRMLDRVGLLDDRFFMYFEEVDFFRRARRLGFESWCVPTARVVHLEGQSSGLGGDGWSARRIPRYWFESRHRYFRKHFGYFGMLAADAFWLLGHTLMRLRQLATGVSHSRIAPSETTDLLRHTLRQVITPGHIA